MIDLRGTWQLRDHSGQHELPADLPGDFHTALLAAGTIPDPFAGDNEKRIQWIGQRGWTVSREFTVAAADLEREQRWLLECDSIDTVAELFINDILVARTSNMFVPLRVDVAAALKPGTNRIEVRFDSPDSVAHERAKTLPYPVPHEVYKTQAMHRNLLRKVQCHSSWDWGIAMLVSGVYGSIVIRPVAVEALHSVWGVPRHNQGAQWILPLHIAWDTPAGAFGTCDAPVGAPNQAITVQVLDATGSQVAQHQLAAQPSDSAELPAGVTLTDRGVLRVDVAVHDPQLWWPAGYGEQPLYTVVVRMGAEERSFRTAFRTIEVVNERDEVGTSMFFRVNGRAVWAKGANWIPVDAFPARQTTARYRKLLEDMRGAHMNMVRVWGGGQYEPEVFYDICDELGLLVWQDFMFSCALYPSQQWFLSEVREEVQAQTRRLMRHPSVALWCGNNENIGALGWYEVSRANPGRYIIDFDRLNDGVISKEVAKIDDSRVFWPSSPAAGEGDFSDNWHDDSSGDMHYWSVWHEGKPFAAYLDVTPRFCSEFGFQSFPSMPTLRSFAADDQLNPTAPQMEHHQRAPRGNTVVVETISRYFRFPFDFADFVYLSQVQQAMAIDTAVSYWRSKRPTSMGALYWQLNDLWPVVSWSSIEYDGRWKLLHYEARRFFAPLRVACFVRDGQVEAHLLNDTAHSFSGTLTLRGLDWTGAELWSTQLAAHVAADSAAQLWRSAIAELSFAPDQGFIVASIATKDADAPAAAIERDFTLLTDYKSVPLQQPRIELAFPDERSLHVTCHDAPAFWLTLEPEDAKVQPSDNGLFLLPGESRTIDLLAVEPEATTQPTSNGVTIRTIRSTY